MVRRAIALLIVASAAPVAAQTVEASLKTPPPAMSLFERDWVLMNWALKYYDSNHDVLLEPDEAQKAAEAFRKLADTNNDGRVTTEEYRAARAEILARY
jgi:hypothetical protein